MVASYTGMFTAPFEARMLVGSCSIVLIIYIHIIIFQCVAGYMNIVSSCKSHSMKDMLSVVMERHK